MQRASTLAKVGGVAAAPLASGISPAAAWQATTGTLGAKIAIPVKVRMGVN
jgi:hypothetical protein